MSNSERKQIPLRVSKSQKDNWAEYQEELGYGSREAMIRRAVEYIYAAKTGSAETELTEELSAQIDDIKNTMTILRADVGDVRREQLTTDDVEDIAQEVAYTVETGWMNPIRTQEDINAQLSALGLEDPTESDRFIASQSYLWGLRTAIHQVDDQDERDRLQAYFEDQEGTIFNEP